MKFKSVILAAGAWVMPLAYLIGLGLFVLVFSSNWAIVLLVYSIGWLIGYVSNSFAEYYLKS